MKLNEFLNKGETVLNFDEFIVSININNKSLKVLCFKKTYLLLNPIKAHVPGSHDSLGGGSILPPPLDPPMYLHYIIGIYNILYILKSSQPCHSEYAKNKFLQKLSANVLQHLKKSDFFKNLANLSKPFIKSCQFLNFLFFLWLQAFQKLTHVL